VSQGYHQLWTSSLHRVGVSVSSSILPSPELNAALISPQLHHTPVSHHHHPSILSVVPAKDRSKLFSSSPLIHTAHHSAVTAGQSQPREEDWDECDHFISFAYGDVGGEKRLLELDGTSGRKGVLDRGLGSGDLLVVCSYLVFCDSMVRKLTMMM
jgi:hypothetical protein